LKPADRRGRLDRGAEDFPPLPVAASSLPSTSASQPIAPAASSGWYCNYSFFHFFLSHITVKPKRRKLSIQSVLALV